MSYGEIRRGPMLYAYPTNIVLGITQVRPLMLEALQDKLKNYPLNWTQVKFLDVNRNIIPDAPGVYFFCVTPKAANIKAHHIILYIGKAKKNLRTRYSEYMQERSGLRDKDRPAVVQMLNTYHDKLYFNYCILDEYDTERVEDALLDAFHPPCNSRFGDFKPAF